MEHEKQDIRQISATLDTISENTPTLHTNVEHKSNVSFGAVIKQDEENTPGLFDDDKDLMDLGWNENDTKISPPLMDGISNEDFWLLVRRFNKQIFHLKAARSIPPGALDFNSAEQEDFSPNKLRAQLQRLYMGLLVGLLAFMQHLARLRSWREPRRTTAFCVTYFAFWYVDYLMLMLLVILMALFLFSRARDIMFPPVPIALVDFKTGGLLKPSAGLLASTDSTTGAPENIKGEAIENEASNFVVGISAIAMNILTDKDPQHNQDQKDGVMAGVLPQPNDLAMKVAVAKDNASGVDRPSYDKTKVPMEKIMWSKMRPLMHGMCAISDTWERCANLLAPNPLVPQQVGRYHIASLLLPILIMSVFTTCYAVYRATTFAIGVGFFSDTIQRHIYNWLKLHNFSIVETIVRAIPTDAQLTITLLRLGEARKVPLLPPPKIRQPPPQQSQDLGDDFLGTASGDKPLGATEDELRTAIGESPQMVHEAGGDDYEIPAPDSQGKRPSKVFGVFKSVSKVAAKTVIGVDKMRAKAGVESAKKRVGATSVREKPPIAGPVEFGGRYNGQKGFLYLTTDAVSPCLCFSTRSSQGSSHGKADHEIQPTWIISIHEIMELNKISGYGAKTKLLAGWALDGEVMDGLEIIEKDGRSTLITSVPRRDELFNRLCAIGDQRWEIW